MSAAAVLAGSSARAATGPGIETSRYRVVTSLDVPLPFIGTLVSRPANEIEGSNWLIGCETLDRDYADYDAYKEYLVPLGIRRLRMQGGWSKTEKVRGEYDFAWLDHIINDATARGLQPWLQTSYGNPIYPGGGGANLGAGLPKSAEAMAAYDRWVTALVTRYRDRVVDWEVWNEPNFGDNLINSPEWTADFNVRTARIIKRLQPQARISGLALGHYDRDFTTKFLDRVQRARGFDLFHNITYHDYTYNPDMNAHVVEELKALTARYARHLTLRQGENGAPSAGGAGRGALSDYPWTELSQAKWNTRRMLGNLGMDVESSVFTIADIAYREGPISRLNLKGLLKSDPSKRVARPKVAYYAVQNVASVFDNSLVRLTDLRHTYNVLSAKTGEHLFNASTDRHLAGFGYRSRRTSTDVYSFWLADSIPTNGIEVSTQRISLTNANLPTPVWVDIITGAVHAIPPGNIQRSDAAITISGLPVYDAPILIADRQVLNVAEGASA
jgi:hypothetical protein